MGSSLNLQVLLAPCCRGRAVAVCVDAVARAMLSLCVDAVDVVAGAMLSLCVDAVDVVAGAMLLLCVDAVDVVAGAMLSLCVDVVAGCCRSHAVAVC